MSQIIKKRMVTNRITGKTDACDIVVLTSAAGPQMAILQQEIISNLAEPELFFPLDEDEIQELLGTKGITIGVLLAGQLIGFAAILFPGEVEDNVGIDVGLAKTELAKVAYMKVGNVQPAYRGNSLTKELCSCLWAEALKRNDWQHFYSTASPKNYASLMNIFHLELVIVKLKRKYRDYWRYIFYRNRTKPMEVDAETSELVACVDLNRQLDLLQQGYCGYAFVKDQQAILFGKMK